MFEHRKTYLLRSVIIVIFMLFFAGVSFGQDFNDIKALFNLEITLKTLSSMSVDELSDSVGQWVVLSGTVASLAVINPDENDFMAQIELIDGEWENTDQVFMYQCYILVTGPDWVSRIPAKRSRRSSPEEIPQNSNLLVVGQLAEPYVDDSGFAYPVVDGYYIRIIQ